MPPDWLLLRRYAKENSQEAFAALTARYLNLVYSVCLREVHDPDLAQDVTQAVFLLLARTAPAFRSKTALPGWLFRSARFAAQNTRTRETRRRHYEEKAVQMMQAEPPDAAWEEIEPFLNQSLAALREDERECVLLRFFQSLSFVEVGATLGISEEAARKRVMRALEKMRRFFGKEGVTVSGTALVVLLPPHAAKAAPAHLTRELTRILAGQIPCHAALISQGVLRSMKLFKLKVAAGAAALFLTGATAYTMVHSVQAKSAAGAEVRLDDPINAEKAGFSSPGEKDAVRNVVFVGKVRYEDGRPAEGVPVAAQIQDKIIREKADAANQRLGKTGSHTVTIHYSKEEQEASWNNTVSRPDGTYELPVGANIPYNVMVFDESGKWVAAAVEGASGAQKSTVKLPDLILTKGSLVVGRVTTSYGVPVPYVMVQSYGPHRPATTAATVGAATDLSGYYRLRVAPGHIRVYAGGGPGEDKTIPIKSGQIVTADLQINPLNQR